MKRAIAVSAVLVAAVLIVAGQRPRWGRAAPDSTPPLGKTDTEKRILAVLDQAQRAGEVWASVPPADGRVLRLLAETAGAKNVIEIGTSTGYSGLWFCLALQATGGKLTTFEIDAGRAAMAKEHFRKAGVDRLVTIVQGDAHENIARLKEPVDVLFIDADKEGYVDYLNRLLPLVRPGGLILAHNVNMAPDYVKQVTTSPDLDTVFFTQGNDLSVTLKKR